MPIILGIDPGLNGAIAIYDTSTGELTLHDTPTAEIKKSTGKKREIVAGAVSAILGGQLVDHAIVEHVWARQGEAASNSFTFGCCFGVVLGALAGIGIPYTMVNPATWQKAVGVRVPRGGDTKDAGRARASELFPNYAASFLRKGDSGKADAALLAYYGARERP